MSVVDKYVTNWIAGRVEYAQKRFGSSKYRTRRKAPPYIAAEIEKFGLDFDELERQFDLKKLQYLATAIPWIYSNINRIAREVSSTPLHVFEAGTQEKDFDHEAERLIMRPNEFFSGSLLLQYTIWAMYLDEWGAFWYLMPDSRRPGQIEEIWPVQMNRLKPVKHKNKFIKEYEYKTAQMKKPIKIPARYIARFFFPNPFDLFKSLTPLGALRSGISLYENIAAAQNTLYGQGRGIPLSLVTVDENISDADFDVVRQSIQEEWREGGRIAVAKAGTIDVRSIGISNRDLETIASQELNRNEMDVVFMDVPWRTENMGEGERKEINRQIKEHVIHPLHRLLAGQVDIQLIDRFYDESLTVSFDDVRKSDRALFIQEFNVTQPAKTLDEARKELNLPKFEHELLPGLGELPMRLATNPSFIANLYGLEPVREANEQLPETGNVIEGRDPQAIVAQEARGGDREDPLEEAMSDARGMGMDTKSIDVTAAIESAQKEELKRYRTVCLRALKRNGTPPHEITFDTEIIPAEKMLDINDKLSRISTDEGLGPEGIRQVFGEYL